MSESLTTKQVAEHNTVEKGLYIIVDNDVYKMDSFVDEHPGGAKILKRVGGKDASKQFWKVRYSQYIWKARGKEFLGRFVTRGIPGPDLLLRAWSWYRRVDGTRCSVPAESWQTGPLI